jgi:hypothetical protein
MAQFMNTVGRAIFHRRREVHWCGVKPTPIIEFSQTLAALHMEMTLTIATMPDNTAFQIDRHITSLGLAT